MILAISTDLFIVSSMKVFTMFGALCEHRNIITVSTEINVFRSVYLSDSVFIQHSFVEIGHELISTTIRSLSLIVMQCFMLNVVI